MTTYTLFSGAAPVGASVNGALNTLATEFNVSQLCVCNGVWFYSPDASGLPPTIALWKVSGASLITSNPASWSGAAGSGWVFAAFTSPPTLSPSTEYRFGIVANGFDYDVTSGYWTTGGAGAGGITNGPLTAPGTSNGQGWFNAGATLTFPGSQFGNDNWWIDVSVTPVKMSALQDTFATNDLATLWANSYGTFGAAGGRASVQVDTSYSSGLQSTFTYDFTGSYLYGRIFPYIAPSSNSFLGISLNSSNQIFWQYSGTAGGQISGALKTAGSTVFGPTFAYDPVAHAWWRLRESGGTVFFDTSPDGTTWVNRWSSAYTINVTSVLGIFTAGDFGTDPTSTTYITDVNITPTGGDAWLLAAGIL